MRVRQSLTLNLVQVKFKSIKKDYFHVYLNDFGGIVFKLCTLTFEICKFIYLQDENTIKWLFLTCVKSTYTRSNFKPELTPLCIWTLQFWQFVSSRPKLM